MLIGSGASRRYEKERCERVLRSVEIRPYSSSQKSADNSAFSGVCSERDSVAVVVVPERVLLSARATSAL